MFRIFLFLVLLFASHPILAAPNHELDAATAIKLIEMRAAGLPPSERPLASDIRVALIHEGISSSGELRLTHVRRVISIENVLEKGSKVRRSVSREFHWSDEYGWHLWETRMDQGGETIWIWSETKGQVVVR